MDRSGLTSSSAGKTRFVGVVGVALAASAIGLLPASAGASATRPSYGTLTPRLAALASPSLRSKSLAKQARALSVPPHGAGSLLREGERVLVDVSFARHAASRTGDLRAAGARIVNVSRRYQRTTVAVAPAKLRALSRVRGVRSVVEVLTPMTSSTCPAGNKVSEGDTQLNAAAARTQFGVDGTGVKVGVLSDSFDRHAAAVTHASGDASSGDLPGVGNTCGHTTPVQNLHDEHATGEDEGRAMLQIVHDLAPGAPLAFATASTGETTFADNIRALQTAGAKVIVDDVTYFDEPFYQDGPVAVAVNDVTALGSPYFSSAANNNITSGGNNVASWEAPAFRDSGSCPTGVPAFATHCMDFNPSATPDNTYGISVPNGRTVKLDLQWAQPWFGVTTDLDSYLVSSGGTLLASSESFNVHGFPGTTEEPFEFLSWSNTTGSTQTVHLAINRCDAVCAGGPGPDSGTPRLKVVFAENGGQSIVPTEYTTSSGGDVVGPSIFGHNGAANAVSTAAVPYNNSATPEAFSSRGPTTLYFGPVLSTTPAAPLGSPQVLAKPDIAATDCGVTTFFAFLDGADWRFCGTSAAAPHAGAIAALQLQANPAATVAEVRAAQTANAVPVGAFPHEAVGAGLIDAVGAVGAVIPHTLTVNRTGSGTGTVTSSPAGINCGSTCSHDFAPQTVTLSASPAARSSFTSWSGAGCSGQGTCAADTSADATVTARFDDTTAPTTTIHKKPKKNTTHRTAKFTFTASEGGVDFECKIDKKAFKNCSSPTKYENLEPKKHNFRVRGTDAAGNTGPPAKYSWKVEP